jgi:hypothetical protein
VFSATLKVTVPGPVKLVAEVIVRNNWLDVIVKVQFDAADTKMLCVLAAKPTSMLVWGTVMVQLAVGRVGELLLVHDHARHVNTSTASGRICTTRM